VVDDGVPSLPPSLPSFLSPSTSYLDTPYLHIQNHHLVVPSLPPSFLLPPPPFPREGRGREEAAADRGRSGVEESAGRPQEGQRREGGRGREGGAGLAMWWGHRKRHADVRNLMWPPASASSLPPTLLPSLFILQPRSTTPHASASTLPPSLPPPLPPSDTPLSRGPA